MPRASQTGVVFKKDSGTSLTVRGRALVYPDPTNTQEKAILGAFLWVPLSLSGGQAGAVLYKRVLLGR